MTAGIVCDSRAEVNRLAHALWNLGIKAPHVHRDGTELLIQHDTLTQPELDAVLRCLQDPHGARDITWGRVNAEIERGA